MPHVAFERSLRRAPFFANKPLPYEISISAKNASAASAHACGQ
jgi:hypothetical protein